MNGSKTAKTPEKLGQRPQHGESQTDWARVRREQSLGLEPAADPDSPDAAPLIREIVLRRRAGRPPGSGRKEQVAIRFDRDVLARFRASGPGWQTRMNDALREWLATHPIE